MATYSNSASTSGQSGVSKYMLRGRKSPSQTWRTFLENHAKQLVSIDFFSVPAIRFRVLDVLVVLAHDRCRIVHSNVTAHPTAEWTRQHFARHFPLNNSRATCCATATRRSAVTSETRSETWVSEKFCQRPTKPEEVAQTALLLTSTASSYVTGVELSVDGAGASVRIQERTRAARSKRPHCALPPVSKANRTQEKDLPLETITIIVSVGEQESRSRESTAQKGDVSA